MPSLRDSILFLTRTPDLRPGLMNAAASRLESCIPPLQPEFGSHALTEAHPFQKEYWSFREAGAGKRSAPGGRFPATRFRGRDGIPCAGFWQSDFAPPASCVRGTVA